MADIYEQHDKAFQHVSAYVVVKNGERVATVAFKYPKDGAGRLWCYVHWIGQPMVRSWATGCGYDKRSAAASGARQHAYGKLPLNLKAGDPQWDFWEVIGKDDGYSWDRRLQDAGFTVWQAV